ncbi:hypothetical protein Enr8_25830 [Blastopirellula retiformator]|uniref:Uncharacterized protein n=1 Tax=Blastopirellula retiformator TaxID=2527970 RepID=A0A5C5V4T3_9BACT|nr:hypothetical protein Enr8_25830 [Blastopirellula retiformator]
MRLFFFRNDVFVGSAVRTTNRKPMECGCQRTPRQRSADESRKLDRRVSFFSSGVGCVETHREPAIPLSNSLAWQRKPLGPLRFHALVQSSDRAGSWCVQTHPTGLDRRVSFFSSGVGCVETHREPANPLSNSLAWQRKPLGPLRFHALVQSSDRAGSWCVQTHPTELDRLIRFSCPVPNSKNDNVPRTTDDPRVGLQLGFIPLRRRAGSWGWSLGAPREMGLSCE